MGSRLTREALYTDPRICQSVKDAARFIDENPGVKGQRIADAIHISFDHFRKSVVPVLKQYGYRNYHNGNGYFPPSKFDLPENPIEIPQEPHRQTDSSTDI